MSTVDQAKQDDKLFQSLITGLSILKKNIGIYPPGHTTINRTCSQLLEVLWGVFENDAHITIAATKKVLSINGNTIEPKTPHVQELALFLNQRGIASLTIQKGVEAEGLQEFFRLALAIPQGSLLYQAQDIKERLKALDNISTVELDFSGVLLNEDGTSADEAQKGKTTTLWQTFMLGCLPNEDQNARNEALSDTTAGYDRDAFRQFCIKHNVTPGHLLKSYEEMLKKVFSSTDEYSSALVGKQAFLQSIQEALVDLAEELKNQLLTMTAKHLSDIEDDALIEDMLFSMPGEMLLAALERISGKAQEISPALTKLLANLSRAQEQGGAPDATATFDSATREKIQKLLNKERYDEYVPEDYSNILQKISAGLISADSSQTVRFDVDAHLPSLQDDCLNRDITIALLALMDSEIEAQIYADFSARVARGIAGLLSAREYALLVTVYKSLVRHVSDKRELIARNAAAAAVDAFSQDRCIALLADAFSQQHDSKDKALEELVMLTGARNLGWLVKQYLQQHSDEQGQQLFVLLCRFGARAAEESVRILPDCTDVQTIALLKLIRVNGDNACMQPVRRLLDRDNSDVRLEALRTLLKIKDASAVPLLKKMLYDKDRRLLEKSLVFIQENDVRELAPDLAFMIKTVFISKDCLARNRAFLSVLGSLGNTSVLPVLRKKAYAKFSFTPMALRQTQYFLYKSLAGYPREAIQGLVQRGLRSRHPGVRRACQEIINAP